MKGARWAGLLLVMAVAAVAGAGDIQILCEPGIRVYLDDELAGISSRLDDGLYLMDVARGPHTVRVEKDGFRPQSFEVVVGAAPLEVSVEEFEALPAEPTGAASVPGPAPVSLGSLVVTSAPQNCVVEIDGTPHTKTTPQLTIGGLAAGEHTVEFFKPGYEPVSERVTIHPGGTVAVRGNLKAGELEAVHQGQGSLRVLCKPAQCTIRFMGRLERASGGRLNMTHLPAGEYRLVVSIPGREIETDIVIMGDHRTLVEASFMKGDEPFVVSHTPR
jgi:hypothetical protein